MSSNIIFLSSNEHQKSQFRTLNKIDQILIETHSKDLKKIRDCLSEELLNNLRKVDEDILELKKAVALNIQKQELHYFKNIAHDIDDQIEKNDNFLNLKQKELLEQEKQLFAELKEIEQNIFDSHQGRSTSKILVQYKPLENYHVHLPESILSFDKFVVKQGGHFGGWKPEDHQLFVQLKNKGIKIEDIAKRIQEDLPDISGEMVIAHSTWYDQYSKLLQDKKDTIEKWKESKVARRSKSAGNISRMSLDKNNKRPSTGRQLRPRYDKEEVKKQIEAWKAERAIKLKKEEEKKKEIEERQKLLEKEKKEIQQMNKDKLELYKQMKTMAELKIKAEKECLIKEQQINRARKANILINVFRKQDERKLKEKLDKKKETVNKEIENKERLNNVKSGIDVRRDPERVLQPTTGWKKKTQLNQDESETSHSQNLGFIQHVSKLKIPNWRQDLRYEDQIVL